MPQKYFESRRPKAGTSPVQPTMVHSWYAWHQHGQPTDSVWYSDGSLLEVQAGKGVVHGPMRIPARVPGPLTMFRAETCGVCVVAYLAKLGDSIVLDNRVAARFVSKLPTP